MSEVTYCKDEEIHDTTAEEVSGGKIGHSKPDGCDVDGQFGEGGGTCEEDTADEEPAEASDFGNLIGAKTQDGPRDEDDGGETDELSDEDGHEDLNSRLKRNVSEESSASRSRVWTDCQRYGSDPGSPAPYQIGVFRARL